MAASLPGVRASSLSFASCSSRSVIGWRDSDMDARLLAGAGRLFLDELDQGPERGLRMHERDGRPAAPRAGCLVDHTVAVGLHRLERLRAVGDAVADVVDALALRREVFRDGRVVTRGRQQL